MADTPSLPQHSCKRPCHDCPFRSDIVPYQSTADVERNLQFLLDPRSLALCHWTAHSEGRKGPERACAGFLLTLERLGLFNYWAPKYRPAPRLDCPVPTYPSLAEFTQSAPAHAQSDPWSRWWAWLENQPAHRRALLLQELYAGI